MSFLESIQHGLEKASQEASRITKIQHLHNVTNDLTFKVSQEGQVLVGKAMEMYNQGILAQGELTAICQQIATYQQQLNEVHEELQRLQKDAGDGGQQIPLPPQPDPAYAQAPAGYPAYPQPPAGYAYPAPYPTPPAGYPAYPQAATQPAYPAYPASPSGEPPTRPGAPSQFQSDEPPTQPLSFSNEPPTAPGGATPAPAVQAEAPAPAPHKPRQHHAAAPQAEDAPAATTNTPAPQSAPVEAAPTAGTYANGVLPPVFSPFTNNPAASAAPAEAEPEKPARAHHTKKATESAAAPEAPAPEK